MRGGEPTRVLHTVRSLRVDGIARAVGRTVEALDPGRVASVVASIRPEDALAGELADAGFEPRMLGHRRPWHVPRTVVRLAGLIRRERIDLVHTNQSLDFLLAGVAARMCRVPVVATIHWLGDFQHFSERGAWARERRRARVRLEADRLLATRIVVVSEAVRESQRRIHGARFPVEKTRVVHPGLPTDLPPPAEDARVRLREELGLGPSTPVVLNVGRLHAVKGQRYLIPMMEAVVRRHPEAVLLVAGGGPLRAELEEAARSSACPAAIRLLGSRGDVDTLLAVADVLVMSSESEAAPLPLMEAGRARRPVVATSVGGAPEIVRDEETGFLVPPRDPAALARRVIELLDDPDLARRMGEAARRRVEAEFDIDVVTRRLEAVYREVTEGGSPAP